MPRELTKAQRRRVRELAALAHERELAAELAHLEPAFAQWRSGEIDVHALNDLIHTFHQGPSRTLYVRYVSTSLHHLAVADAVARGVVSESELGAEVLKLLSDDIAYLRERESA